MDHISVSGIRALRELKAKGQVNPSLAFPVVFTSMINNVKEDNEKKEDSWFDQVSYGITQTPQVFLDHQVSEREGALTFIWDTVEEAFTPGTIKALFSTYKEKLHATAQGKETVSQKVPTLYVEPDRRYESFPLTDVQQAYLFGRTDRWDNGNTSCQFYQEFEVSKLDVGQLEKAWNALIKRHEMLRAIIQSKGTQKILSQEAVPQYKINVTDLSDLEDKAKDNALDTIRKELLDKTFPLDQWPFFAIAVVLLPKAKAQLHIKIDLLIADGNSIQLLFKEWFALYEKPNTPILIPELSFRDYLISLERYQQSQAYKIDLLYWEKSLRPSLLVRIYL